MSRDPREAPRDPAGLRRAPRIRTMFLTTGMLLAAVAVGLLGAGGTYAYLSAGTAVVLVPSTSATTATITAGTANLQVSGTPVLSGLYPGSPPRTASFTVKNTGTVALVLSAGALGNPGTPLSAGMTIGLNADSSGTPCATVAPTWSSTFGGAPSGSLTTTLAAAATVTLCISATLAADVAATAQASSAAFTLTINGRQP